MSEEDEQAMIQAAADAGRDPRSRRWQWVGVGMLLLGLTTFGVSGWMVLVSTQNSAATLATQVLDECSRGALKGAICEQADDTEKTVDQVPVPGVAGKDGRDGEDGKDGVDGKDGKPGKPGRAGRDGSDGKDGVDGADAEPVNAVDGKDGADGVDGKDGADGKPGRGVKSIECTGGTGTFVFTYDDGTSDTVSCAPDPIEPEPSSDPNP